MVKKPSKMEEKDGFSLVEFSDRDGAVLVKYPGEIKGDVFTLSRLRNCEVVLLDWSGQLNVEELVNCKVFLGPCIGASFVRSCRGCTFTMTTSQLRVLESYDCTFFVAVSSDPIIEKSSELYFGRFNGTPNSPTMNKLRKEAGFVLPGDGKWKNVFDFNAQGGAEEANWSLVEGNQALLDIRTGRHSPLGLHKLREMFWTFDADRDGGLSYEEVNVFQRAIGSEEVLANSMELRDYFEQVGLELDQNGNLPLTSFVELYKLQGEDNLISDLLKLGMQRHGVEVFDISVYEKEESTTQLDDTDDDVESIEDTYWNPCDCALSLCTEARRRGVNLKTWFANYDPELSLSIPRKDFETAFSALLLGLCAGSSNEFVQDVERILDPPNLDKLCEQFVDHKNPERVRYISLVLRTKAKENPVNTSLMSSGVKSFIETEDSVKDYLAGLFKKLKLENKHQELYEKIRLSIQAWKWSEAGRTPTRSGGAGEFISTKNLGLAFRATISVNFSQEQLSNFVEMIEITTESDVEGRARVRVSDTVKTVCETGEESPTQGRDEEEDDEDDEYDDDGFEDDGSSSGAGGPAANLSGEPGKRATVMASEEHPVTVAAVMRWIGGLRHVVTIPREAWLSKKREDARQFQKEQLQQLNTALAGDLKLLHVVTKGWSRDVLNQVLVNYASENQCGGIVPSWAIKGEATGRANEILNSVEGASLIRKRAVHLAIDLGGSQSSASMMKSSEQAREEIQAELVEKEERDLKTKTQPQIDLLLEYGRGRENGTVSVQFEEFLRQREQERKKKRRALLQWERSKQSRFKAKTTEEQYVALCSDLITKVRALVSRTYKQQKDSRSGYLICRSTRYAGLDAENAISSFMKKNNDDVLVTQKEFREHFGGVLTTLTADPKTSEEALALLDPLSASRNKLEAFLMTKKGKQKLNDMVDRNMDRKPGRQAAKSEAREILRRDIEAGILRETGFRMLKSKEEGAAIVKQALEEKRVKADTEYQKWLKSKTKQQRQQSRQKRMEMKQKRVETMQRKTQARREYLKWTRAVKKGAYYTYKEDEKKKKKKKKVLKPRNNQTDPEKIAELLSRPAWE